MEAQPSRIDLLPRYPVSLRAADQAIPRDPKTPISAPPRMRKAGLIPAVRNRMTNTATAMTTAYQSSSAPLARVIDPARTRPTDTGAGPCWIALR